MFDQELSDDQIDNLRFENRFRDTETDDLVTELRELQGEAQNRIYVVNACGGATVADLVGDDDFRRITRRGRRIAGELWARGYTPAQSIQTTEEFVEEQEARIGVVAAVEEILNAYRMVDGADSSAFGIVVPMKALSNLKDAAVRLWGDGPAIEFPAGPSGDSRRDLDQIEASLNGERMPGFLGAEIHFDDRVAREAHHEPAPSIEALREQMLIRHKKERLDLVARHNAEREEVEAEERKAELGRAYDRVLDKKAAEAEAEARREAELVNLIETLKVDREKAKATLEKCASALQEAIDRTAELESRRERALRDKNAGALTMIDLTSFGVKLSKFSLEWAEEAARNRYFAVQKDLDQARKALDALRGAAEADSHITTDGCPAEESTEKAAF